MYNSVSAGDLYVSTKGGTCTSITSLFKAGKKLVNFLDGQGVYYQDRVVLETLRDWSQKSPYWQ